MIHYICKYTPIELFAGFGAECIRREPLVSGFELADGASHQNLCAFSRALLEDCLQNGLLILTAKTLLRLLPPLNITREELDKALSILESVLERIEDQ